MERLGILELTEITATDRQAEAIAMVEAANLTNQEMFLTVMRNDFEKILEGFTGVYLRDYQYQIVPNELIPAIKEISLHGFSDVPEDHELFLFVDWFTAEGRAVGREILEMVTNWLEEHL
ncbi:hypothetical protein [Dyadobacter frigoris]|uniref:Uncharacterized protein n=1 Tax=Dyadobacter frigoris TaxID=2576211 RepID=A0A4U6D084_9BACT|nr:hypothetical protein [Dyadobacter frigoris]TKT89501.1 hypothetical protein FDK13_24470 [Dyadobacter frigoris]